MAETFTCFLSGDTRDVAETAAALHGKDIATSYIPDPQLDVATLPSFCPPAVAGGKANLILELTIADLAAKRRRLLTCLQFASKQSPILSCSVTVSAGEQASWLDAGDRLIGFSYLPAQFSRKLLEIAPHAGTGRDAITGAEDFAIRLAMEISVIQDRIGMVLPRVIVSLVNEAFFTVMEGAADPRDIDTAMTLGTSYPQGPIKWGEAVGLRNIVAILDAIYRDTGEDRYRVAPLLRQMGLSSQP